MSGPRALEDDPVSFQDKTLTCKDCGQEFIWTAGEQEFYASRGLQNAPTRCPTDRAARRAQGGGRGGGGGGGGYSNGGYRGGWGGGGQGGPERVVSPAPGQSGPAAARGLRPPRGQPGPLRRVIRGGRP